MRAYGIFVFITIFLVLFIPVEGQKYDYRFREAPAVSWNGINIYDARMLSMGGISITALENSSGIINPAMLLKKPGFVFGASYASLDHQSFQYWGVNEGVVNYDMPITDNHEGVSSFTLTFRLKKCGISAGWYKKNVREFPSFNFRTNYEYDQYESYSGEFYGKDDSFFISVGFDPGKSFNLGFKIEYIKGRRKVRTKDFMSYYYYIDGNWVLKDIYVEHRESHTTGILVPSFGTVIRLSPCFISGLTISYPLRGNADRKVTREFYNSYDIIGIEEKHLSEDNYYLPPGVSLGFVYNIPLGKIFSGSDHINIAFGIDYSFWSGYEYHFFSEATDRDFKDTLSFSGGVEFYTRYKRIEFLLRGGFRSDGQPVKDPGSRLSILSGGIGVRYMALGVDFGIAYITVSPGGVKQEHLAAVTNFYIKPGRVK